MNQSQKKSVLILGAGLSGLTLGYLMSQRNFPVTLLEKSSGVGGRLATRRGEGGHWNHGTPWLDRSDIPERIWKVWADELIETATSLGLRLTSSLGLTHLAKLLAKDLTLIKKSKVVKVEFVQESSSWIVFDDSGRKFQSDLLVLSSPAPQTIELLANSGLLEKSGLKQVLNSIRYRPVLVGLVTLTGSGSSGIKEKTSDSPFELVIENDGFITFYLDEPFSSANWDRPDEELGRDILNLIEKQNTGSIKHFELKRWKYGQCLNPSETPYGKAVPPYPLYLIGDTFSGGGIRGAFNSALNLLETLQD